MTGPEHAVAAAAGAHRRSGEYLHRAVDRHQAGLHTELRVAFSDLLTKFRQRLMRFGLDFRVCDLGLAIRDLGSTAIAMVDR
jgi:hypothetical protein